jgi:hypothetical protein
MNLYGVVYDLSCTLAKDPDGSINLNQCGTEATIHVATYHAFDFFKTKASRHTLSGDFEEGVVF